SGIQPTGAIHLGNYLGAIRNWIDLQNSGEDTIFSIVDLHAITLSYDHTALKNDIMTMAATIIACGIDPKKSILYQQSQVLEHTSLCWILSCLTTMPRLSQLPQYKEKSSKFTNKSVPTGLFIYPVLQSADILLYKTTHVPVGEDQIQHIQLASHLAKLFNGIYGSTFPIPEALIYKDTSARIKSLRSPLSKMSKSEKDPKSRIDLLDSPDTIREKVKKSITDFTSAVYFDAESRPGVSNLMTLHKAFSGKSYECIEKENSDIDTGKYKKVLAEVLVEYLSPIRTKTLELMKEKDYLEKVIQDGNDKARTRAQNTLAEVYKKVGFS
ncbi:UNVERIFIED_CONTAM: hypothetical protein GTU68_037284, partial [Idotea baltica]|nr:hypothetical protein [Idotea baltica]